MAKKKTTKTKKSNKKNSRLNYRNLAVVFVLACLALGFLSWRGRTVNKCILIGTYDDCFLLQRVTSEGQQEIGLSGRDHLAHNRGMLFVYDDVDQRCMWMKDMKFPLDLVWLDAKARVAQITRDVTPDTYPNSFCGMGQYVIELNSGIADKAGLQLGDKIDL